MTDYILISNVREDWRIMLQRFLCRIGLHKWDDNKNMFEDEKEDVERNSYCPIVARRICLYCYKQTYLGWGGWREETEPLIILSGRD